MAQADYCSLICDDIAGRPRIAVLTALEKHHSGVLTAFVQKKGSSDEFVVRALASWLDGLASPAEGGGIVLRTDPEPAVKDLVREAAARREETTHLQISPKRSKGALGAAEG